MCKAGRLGRKVARGTEVRHPLCFRHAWADQFQALEDLLVLGPFPHRLPLLSLQRVAAEPATGEGASQRAGLQPMDGPREARTSSGWVLPPGFAILFQFLIPNVIVSTPEFLLETLKHVVDDGADRTVLHCLD